MDEMYIQRTAENKRKKKKGKRKGNFKRYRKATNNVQQCSKCGQLFPYTSDVFFYISKGNGKAELSTHCRECRRRLAKKYYDKDKARKNHGKWLERRAVASRFGEHVSTHEVHHKFPNGCCICGEKTVTKLNPVTDRKNRVVDVICWSCYQGLQKFSWDDDMLSQAISFLDRFYDENLDVEWRKVQKVNGGTPKGVAN